jgi:hypothetical protein
MSRQKRKSVLELRRMQIVAEVGAENNSTTVMENNSTTVIMMPVEFRKSVRVSARQGSPFRARRVSNPWTRLCGAFLGPPAELFLDPWKLRNASDRGLGCLIRVIADLQPSVGLSSGAEADGICFLGTAFPSSPTL